MENSTIIRDLLTVKATEKIKEYQWSQVQWLGFAVLHIPLALAMNSFRLVSTIHAILTLCVGLYVVVTARSSRQVAWVTAYVCGAEILWRMTEARVFWEYGKYAIVLLMVIALMRLRKVKKAGLPIMYFLLLVISIPLTLFDLPFDAARQSISFNLSGPLCLAVSVIFFSQVSMNFKDRAILSWYVVAPIIGVAALCIRGVLTAEELVFTTESSFGTSGGYGPNQVSAILGMGALLLILMAIQENGSRKVWVPLILAIGLVTLSVLTFSRGGLYNIGASLLVIALFSLRSSRLRNSLLPILLISMAVGAFLIYPRLNEFTDGMLEVRFSDTDPTNRWEIMKMELALWQANPMLGVGPGMGVYIIEDIHGLRTASHTEYTRMLAEHGIMGFFSICIMVLIGIKSVLKAQGGLSQGLVAAMVAWPLMEMTHAAMRISAIGFIFGLAAAMWSTSQASTKQEKRFENPTNR